MMPITVADQRLTISSTVQIAPAAVTSQPHVMQPTSVDALNKLQFYRIS